MKRKPRATGWWLYKQAHRFLTVLFFFWGLKVEGLENLPEKGGVILAGNHTSYLDPPVLGTSVDRMVFFMAKIELFDIPISINLGSPSSSSIISKGSAHTSQGTSRLPLRCAFINTKSRFLNSSVSFIDTLPELISKSR